jgi:hypothetical protein
VRRPHGPYTRYPPRFTMSAAAWLTLGILIGILIGFICIKVSE